jgi:ABC-type branched-subunit amino acid transport system ATPase component
MALLEVNNITVIFAGLRALSAVCFEVNAGQICAVIGPNGAGKSTLFNVITGYATPTEGNVFFNGRSVIGRSPHAIASAGVRRTFQNGGVFGEMTVLENVLTGLDQLTPSRPLELLFNFPRSVNAERSAVREARSMLEFMGLAEHADKVTGDLSSGQQRMVEITRAIAARARLLLLDEPAVGLSVIERERLATVLRNLASEGIAVLLIEHQIDLVMDVSDRIVVLNYGEVIAEDTPEKIRSHEAVLEAYLGHT